MTYFTDSPFERMMVQKPGPVGRPGAQVPARLPGHKCYGCVYGTDRPCVGLCMRKVLAVGQEEGEEIGAER